MTSVHVFDVGQGDSILVELPADKIFVIDCHAPADGNNPTLCFFKERLRQRKPINIDVLCITHPDRDHYSGVLQLIEWVENNGGVVRHMVLYSPFAIREFNVELGRKYEELLSQQRQGPTDVRSQIGRIQQSSQAFTRLHKKLVEIIKTIYKGEHVCYRPRGFAHLFTYEDVNVFALGPTGSVIDRYKDEVIRTLVEQWVDMEPREADCANELSCILWISARDYDLLFTGDASAETIERCVNEYNVYHRSFVGKDAMFNFVKVPHHGAESGASETLWPRILNSGCVLAISAGRHRKYRHPTQETLQSLRLARPDLRLLCTNRCLHHPLEDDEIAGAVSASIQACLDDESLPIVETKRRKYQGDCRVTFIGAQITVDCEKSPVALCPFHEAKPPP